MVVAVASMWHGREGSSSTSGMAPRPWHGSTAMRAANSAGYDEGREGDRERQKHSSGNSGSGIERCSGGSGDSGSGTEHYSVAAAAAVSRAGAGQRHGVGDQASQARQHASARRAHQRRDGGPPWPSDRAQPRGLAREHVVHGF